MGAEMYPLNLIWLTPAEGRNDKTLIASLAQLSLYDGASPCRLCGMSLAPCALAPCQGSIASPNFPNVTILTN